MLDTAAGKQLHEMHGVELVAYVVLSVFFWCLGVWLLPQVWHNERGLHLDTPPPHCLNPRLHRAKARAMPMFCVMFIVVIPLAGLVMALGEDGPGYSVWGPIVGLVVIVVFGLIASVMWTNRPRFLVAPHHRDQPGWIDEIDGKPWHPTPPPTHPPHWHRRPA